MHKYLNAYIPAMLAFVKQKNMEKPLSEELRQELLKCWPALKGSLAEVFKPCIRPNCAACAKGEKHPNYLLAFTQDGRRRCLYVPKSMVPVLKRALNNGRRIEKLLYEMGPALLRQYREENPSQTGPAVKPKPRQKRSKS